MNNKSPKMINQLHLIYFSIIAGAAIVFVITLYYGGGNKAGEMLSFAATLSSILLSVIAIVMTIVDVAGQRNTVTDLKETAEKLEENLITANQGISDINNLKEELMASMNSIIKSNLAVSKEIADLKAKYTSSEKTGNESDDPKKNKDIINDLNNLSDKMQKIYIETRPKRINNIMPGHYKWIDLQIDENKQASNNIRNFLIQNFMEGVEYEFVDFYNLLQKTDLNISRSRLKNEINLLVKSGALERIDNRYYKIVKK